MSSWKAQITGGFRELALGVGGMVTAAGAKAADLAEQVDNKLDQLAARLLETSEPDGLPEYVTKDEMTKVAGNMGYVALGRDTWNWIHRMDVRDDLAERHSIKLHFGDGNAVLRTDLKCILDGVRRSDIRLYGKGKVELLTALTAGL